MTTKKILAPLMIILIGVACHAQDSHLDRFYQKFDAGGAETAKGSINLSLMMNFGGTDSSDGWMKKVTMCRFLTLDPEKTAKAAEEWTELTSSLKEDHFEEWMSVRKGKGNFRILSRDRRDGQEDIVCVAADEHGAGVFFHLRGRFTAADKDRIRASMDNGDMHWSN